MKTMIDVEWEIEQIRSAINYYVSAMRDAKTSEEISRYEEQVNSLRAQQRELEMYY